MVLTIESLYERMNQAPMEEVADFYHVGFFAMGTNCQVNFSAPSPARAREFRQRFLRWLAEFEAKYSRFIPDSLISRINQSAGRAAVEIDAETEGLFKLCDWFFWTTRGLLDISSLPLIQLWDYHVKRTGIPNEAQIQQALKRVGWGRVVRNAGTVFLPEPGMGIDLGGIGKEYAVDRVLEMGLEHGLQDIIVDFGHDLRVHGEPPERGPWRIGLEDPRDPGKCRGGVAVLDRAVCTSGSYLRNFEINGRVYGHILDPRTGYPVNNGCLSSTVVAPTCTGAGVLSTASFILGAEEGTALMDHAYQAEGCIFTRDSVHQSRGFNEYLL